MKNETITRLVLILEIGAIVLFHSLKTAPPANVEIVRGTKEPNPIHVQHSSSLVLTRVK